MTTKDAYLLVFTTPENKIQADLVFSSPEAEIVVGYSSGTCRLSKWFKQKMWPFQLVKIQVPEDFNDWDYIPENY